MAQELSAHHVGNAFADAVSHVAPGVVAVLGRKRLPATGTVWKTSESGSIVVTASHVVVREENLTVRLEDNRDLPATLLGRDLTRDLAVLRVDAALPQSVSVASSEARVGTLAMAVGRPFVSSVQASFGSVIYVGSLRYRNYGTSHLIHADPTLYPGFSGGPLINSEGEVLGINTSGTYQQGGITIPASQVARVVDDIVEIGYVRTAWLGITVQQVELPAHVAAVHPEQETGLLLVGIDDDAPAAGAGLYVGDILVTVDDQPLEDVTDLQQLLCTTVIGTSFTVVAWRGDARHDLSVTPVSRPEQPTT